MFSSLRSKLALLYATLFGAVLSVLMVAAYVAIEANAIREVRSEMRTSAAVFERLWQAREAEIANAADVLSRDFGFRAAVATQDAPTIDSALANIRDRFQFDTAFVIDLDGRITGLAETDLPLPAEGMIDLLYDIGRDGGVIDIAGGPVHAVATPIEAPTLVGWVVFGEAVTAADLASVAELSSLALGTQMRWRAGDGRWASTAGAPLLAARERQPGETAVIHETPDGRALVSEVPVASLRPDLESVLVLDYPLALALAPYRAIFVSILMAGMGGLLILMAGTWHLAGQISRPVKLLDTAAGQISRGERPSVVVKGRDELARLAESFNRMSRDIVEREQRITHLALHNSQTGLPNVKALMQEIDTLQARDGGRAYAAAVSIDRFEQIRGAIGFEPAASLMVALARKLANSEAGVMIGRISTDSLGAVFTAVDDDHATRIAARLAHLANAPIRVGNDTVDVHAVVGWLGTSEAGTRNLGPLECAGIAVDQARSARQRLARYDADAYGDPTATLSMMSRMISGLSTGAVFLEHQPKFDIREQRVTGVESLMRWDDPVSGRVRPDIFIAQAEETGHIAPLTEWLIQTVIAEQNRLRELGYDLLFSLNISGRLISEPRFVDAAMAAITNSDARLCFEITETAVIEDPETALAHMKAFRDTGVMISIDDYGEGLSSLSYVRSMPASELKIDKSFILNLDQRDNDAVLVKSTIDLAHSLGMKVTAEGVENAMTLAILSSLGADLAQGYFIARPLRLEALKAFLDEQADAAPAELPAKPGTSRAG